MRAQIIGRQHPHLVYVYGRTLPVFMVRLKEKDRPPHPDGLTAIFKIKYHASTKTTRAK